MRPRHLGLTVLGLVATLVTFTSSLTAQQRGQFSPYATTRIADNVYVFRYQFHQSMVVVTPEGVIATDPISTAGAAVYVEEIKKITPVPVKYVIYSHHHADHISGGAAFQGATFVAHRRARERLERERNPEIVIPTVTVDDRYTIELGGTRLELIYVGRNHSDNSLVMLLPKEKILFAVNFIPVEGLPWRDMRDTYVNEWMESLRRVLQLDFETLIPGHPPTTGRKEHARLMLEYFTDLTAAVKQAHAEGKCPDRARQEIKLPKYEKWGSYAEFLPLNIGRVCKWASGQEL